MDVYVVKHNTRIHPLLSCEDTYYYDSYATECLTCSNTAQVAAPLIAIGAIALVVGGVAAYNYKYNYEAISTYIANHKEQLFMEMNQGTIVVSCACLCSSLVVKVVARTRVC